jgi:hypothetical protein
LDDWLIGLIGEYKKVYGKVKKIPLPSPFIKGGKRGI